MGMRQLNTVTQSICTRKVSTFLIALFSSALSFAEEDRFQIATDINGDGQIHFPLEGANIPSDVSTADTPFVFWLNDDKDQLALYEAWPHDTPDNSDDVPGSLRDLEDMARMHIHFPKGFKLSDDSTLRLAWLDGNSPAIRIWPSADPNGSRRYLLTQDGGEEQLALANSGSFGVIRPGEPLELDADTLKQYMKGNEKLALLFEGVEAGTGQLQAQISSPSASEIPSQTAIAHIELRHIKTFYDRVKVEWPEDMEFVYKYKLTPPVPELTMGPQPLGYEFEQPWYEDDNILVWVHGWIPHAEDDYLRTIVFSFETMWKRLWHQGYRGRVVHFHWPSRKRQGMIGYQESEFRGFKSGQKLYEYMESLPKDKRVHVTCHSLGGVVLAEAVHLGISPEQAIFQVSAIPAEVFDTREDLVIPALADKPTPRDSKEGGFAGYIEESQTRVYNIFNPEDVTWLGWNLVQKDAKPAKSFSRAYVYRPNNDEGERLLLKYWWFFARPVDDHHESMAYITRAKTQAIGGEPRVRGHVHESFNLAIEPYHFGSDHVAMWRWNPQHVMPYSNLLLDLMNVPYNSLVSEEEEVQ